MLGWIDPFYEPADPAVAPGHVWRAQPVALPPAHALTVDRVSPRDDARLSVTVADRTAAPVDHPPVKRLGLRSDDALLAATAAPAQLAIVLSAAAATDFAGDADTRDADTVFVVPWRAIDLQPEPTRRRVAAYGFANAFYLPAAPEHRYPESLARLDHAQPVPRASLTAHQGFALSSDALDALVEWFVAYSTGRRFGDSLIAQYRAEKLAELG
jgi:hypothetical protein